MRVYGAAVAARAVAAHEGANAGPEWGHELRELRECPTAIRVFM